MKQKQRTFRPLEEVVSPEELQRIRDSATFFDFAKTLKGKEGKGPLSVIRTPADSKQALLDWLQYQGEDKDGRMWEEAGRIIREEEARGEFAFRLALGKVLSKEPKDIYYKLDRLDRFLVSHWARGCDGLPELCRLRDVDLAKVCEPHGAGLDAVKRRKRLGLKSCSKKLSMERNQDGTFRFLDNDSQIPVQDKFTR